MPVPRIVLAALGAGMLCAATAPAQAQPYPSRPVRVIVPFAPGGGSDIAARQFSAKLVEAFGQQFVVDNRGGAGGLIGMELTAKAPPDGYTIMMIGGGFAATAATQQPVWDPINSIIPVVEFGITPFILIVHPGLAATTTGDLIALARSRPGQIPYASTGTGSLTHLATELFATMAKIKLIHVPYKGTGPAMIDLLSGQVPVIVGSLLPMMPHLENGKLRPIAVTTAKRWYTLPDVPALTETLPGCEVELSLGTLAPRGTPQLIIARLNAALNKAMEQPDMKKNLQTQGMMPTGGPPQRYGERIRRDYARWTSLIKEAGIKIE